ncbi:MAG TPA: hypothetical protein VFY17_11555 [Pilimelia sp.]|nr:hypothetical protein [Pilimelia sp.]
MLSSTRNLRPAWRAVRRFVRYSALSAATVPAGYALLLLAMHRWPHVNAGLLNLGVGMVLTPPSFLLAQVLVWRGRGAAPWWARLWSFWQTVLAGALASSATILVADAVLGVRGAWAVVAGLAGQGVVFVARYFWLDRVTFAGGPPPTGGAGRRAVAGARDARGVGENGGPPPPAGGPAREEARDRQEAAAGQ